MGLETNQALLVEFTKIRDYLFTEMSKILAILGIVKSVSRPKAQWFRYRVTTNIMPFFFAELRSASNLI